MLSYMILSSLLLGETRVSQENEYIFVYSPALAEYSLPNEYIKFDKILIQNLIEQGYTIIDDPNGKFRAIISNEAFSIRSLEEAGSIFQVAAQAGVDGFDSTTPLGKKAMSLIRGYDPFVDESKVTKQPLINIHLKVFANTGGGFSNRSLTFDAMKPDTRGFLEPRDEEKNRQFAEGKYKPEAKGTSLYIAEPFIFPYQVRSLHFENKPNSYDQNNQLHESQKLIKERLDQAMEAYRVGIDSFTSSLSDRLLGGIADKLNTEIPINELPEQLKAALTHMFSEHPRDFGFNSKEEAADFMNKNGKLVLTARASLSVSHSNPDFPELRNGVRTSFPLPKKK